MLKEIYNCQVVQDWVDYNGHLNDAEYARIFSLAVDSFMDQIGITSEVITNDAYTLYTLETHVCFLDEVNLNEKVTVELQLIDHDAKRLHVLLIMKNAAGDKVATSEQMLMGMDLNARRPAPFLRDIATNIENIAQAQKNLEIPKEVGRVIGIRKK